MAQSIAALVTLSQNCIDYVRSHREAKANQVLLVITVITTVFAPASFLAGKVKSHKKLDSRGIGDRGLTCVALLCDSLSLTHLCTGVYGMNCKSKSHLVIVGSFENAPLNEERKLEFVCLTGVSFILM